MLIFSLGWFYPYNMLLHYLVRRKPLSNVHFYLVGFMLSWSLSTDVHYYFVGFYPFMISFDGGRCLRFTVIWLVFIFSGLLHSIILPVACILIYIFCLHLCHAYYPGQGFTLQQPVASAWWGAIDCSLPIKRIDCRYDCRYLPSLGGRCRSVP